MFHTSCVLYALEFYNRTVPIILLSHLGDDHARIYMYIAYDYICHDTYEFYNGLVVIWVLGWNPRPTRRACHEPWEVTAKSARIRPGNYIFPFLQLHPRLGCLS